MLANVTNNTYFAQPPSSRPPQNKPGPLVSNPGKQTPLDQQSELWEKYHLSPQYPCPHCFEWGNWVQECNCKKASLPAVEDPIIKHPAVVLNKSSVVYHHFLLGIEAEDEDPFFASIQEMQEHELLVLLDSGATHHVLGDITLFSNIKRINITLSVSSAKKHLVKGKGKICLECPSGDITLREALCCFPIPGTVISLGNFLRNDERVLVKKSLFYLF
ncbi:hypothetical protein O181_022654 [Austropuccinia psidii MF-1]|uniref:Retrovirus-related Pol polyprotein from transposon TNT 1-94-like beta-barrel domain-containing protein n=1 Tax=Austropuccinia psidii MF-1 TaxID=1389203 RepID=A0A9Q3CD01_9BASI|nr:hypothetical protein [Austropuccinia psidii MF-1]